MSGFSRRRVPEDEYFSQDRNFQNLASANEAAPGHEPKVFTYIGTDAIDYVEGSDHIDVIKGLGGNDRLIGYANDDTLVGGDDDDYLDGVGGRDMLVGGDGNDALGGGIGLDTMIGGAGNDILFLQNGDRAEGGGGDDVFVILDRDETADGGGGTDTVEFDAAIKRFGIEYEDDFILLKDNSLGRMGPHGNPKLTTRLNDSDSIERVAFKDVTIDFENPAAPEFEYLFGHGRKIDLDTLLQNSVRKIGGKADPFSRITLYADHVAIGHAITGKDGGWTISIADDGLLARGVKFSATADYGPGREVATSETIKLNVADFIQPIRMKSDEGLAIKGQGDSEVGSMVSGLGDINGDGHDDFVVNAGGGTAYVLYGKDHDLRGAGQGKILLASTLSAKDGFVIDAPWVFEATKAGDFNGDGYDDLLLSKPGLANDDNGGAVLIFGGPEDLGKLNSKGQRILDVDKLSSTEALYVRGPSLYSIDSDAIGEAGDVNGDGVDDVVIGGRSAMHEEGGKWVTAGEAYILFGRGGERGELENGQRTIDVSTLAPEDGFILRGKVDHFVGSTVSSAGDVNGDGFGDIVVGDAHRGSNPGGKTDIYVVFGHDGSFGDVVDGRSILDLTSLGAQDGFHIVSPTSRFIVDQISGIGDINGDGYDDIVVGVGGELRTEKNVDGHAYVLFGKATGFGTVNLQDLDRRDGFVIAPPADDDFQQHLTVGTCVSAAGDINGDGLDDFIVGGFGATYVIYGSQDGFGDQVGGSRLLNPLNLTSSQGFVIDASAIDVSCAGDVNGDGFDDVIVSYSQTLLAGSAYVVYGGNFTSSGAAVNLKGTSSAEVLLGGTKADTLDGNGGADIFLSGAGNDLIKIGDAGVRQIHAGSGLDTVAFAGAGITFDARDYGNGQLTGIEHFDLTGTGDNALTLDAADIFNFSARGNAAFAAAKSVNNVVVDGNAGDSLALANDLVPDASWKPASSGVNLDGTAGGQYDVYNLVKDGSGAVLASVAVDADIGIL